MPVDSFEGRAPRIGAGTWVHPSADVLGDVRVGSRCWIGPGARLRGDYGTIVLGDCCAVENNCVVHARPVDDEFRAAWLGFKQLYVNLCERYRAGHGR